MDTRREIQPNQGMVRLGAILIILMLAACAHEPTPNSNPILPLVGHWTLHDANPPLSGPCNFTDITISEDGIALSRSGRYESMTKLTVTPSGKGFFVTFSFISDNGKKNCQGRIDAFKREHPTAKAYMELEDGGKLLKVYSGEHPGRRYMSFTRAPESPILRVVRLGAEAGRFDSFEEHIKNSGSKKINLILNDLKFGTRWSPAALVLFCRDDYKNALTFEIYQENATNEFLVSGYQYTINGRVAFFRELDGTYKIGTPVQLEFKWNADRTITFRIGKSRPISMKTQFSANKIMYSISSGKGAVEILRTKGGGEK